MKYEQGKAWQRYAMQTYDLMGTLLYKQRPPKAITEPKKIAFVILHQIGDVVISLSTVEAICSMFPNAAKMILAGSGPASFLANNPWAADVAAVDALWMGKNRILANKAISDEEINQAKQKFVTILSDFEPDMVVVFHPNRATNQLVGSLRPLYSFGFGNAGGGFWLTNSLDIPDAGPQMKRNFVLAEAIAKTFGKDLPQQSASRLWVTNETVARTNNKLSELGLAKGKKWVVFHPFGSAPAKNWPLERWQELSSYYIRAGYQVLVLGGSRDKFELLKNDKSFMDLCGKLSLDETVATISQSALFIGVDSGLAHIAAALQKPLISIFSCVNNPYRWQPNGDPDKTIVLCKPPKEIVEQLKHGLELRYETIPEEIKGNPYIEGITVNDVVMASEKLLGK